MNIDKDIFENIENTIKLVLKSKNIENTQTDLSQNLEFEAILTNCLSEAKGINEFKKIFMYLNSNSDKYINITDQDNETLDITSYNQNNYRLTIKGKQNIINYCKDNFINNKIHECIIKEKVQEPIIYKEYNLKFNLKSEKLINKEEINNVCDLFNKNTKNFRYKKRYSFETISKLFKIDMTIIKKSKYQNKIKFFDSKTFDNNETVELEVEFIPPEKIIDSSSILNTQKCTKELFNIIARILSKIQNSNILISNNESKLIIDEYNQLIDQYKRKYNRNQEFRRFGPKPVSLKIKNILPDQQIGDISILKNYTVTEKADGEGMLLFVAKNKNVYLINNSSNIINTGLKHNNTNTLIDGEFITKDKFGKNIKQFMCFDIYFDNDKDVTNNPLYELDGNIESELNRTKLIKNFLSNLKNQKSSITIKPKTFYRTDNKNSIFKLSQTIYDQNFDYHIDGLIFTPTGGLHENKASLFGSWERLFKWKPPEENTIDFLIKIKESIILLNNNRYKSCELYVGANDIDNFDPYLIFTNKIQYNYKPHLYIEYCLIPIDDNNNIITKNNEIVSNNTIIEFSYNNSEENINDSLRWIPYRIRHDKTDIYLITKSIASGANDITTVRNIWETIIDPISKELITGIINTSTLERNSDQNSNDPYYNRKFNRFNSFIYPMQKFHGLVIRGKYLYSIFKNIIPKSLLEIACGKGGDFNRWIDYKYNPVVGIDINLDNLMNKNDGIYMRYLDNIKKKKTVPNCIFLNMDATKLWDTNYIQNINKVNQDPEDYSRTQYFAKIAFGLNNINSKKSKELTGNNYLNNFNNIFNEKFDFISCQFAIHYFFENEDKLNSFINNIDNHLKNNGYFFGTCLDGERVNKKIIESNNDKVQGLLNDTVLWQITKKYDSYDLINIHNNYGKKIDVYVESIGQEMSEYLVDFNLLVHKLGQKNIKLLNDDDLKFLNIKSSISTEFFEDIYYKELSLKNPLVIAMDNKDLKTYSFLNRLWIFKKY
jgi:SAM-dependent methyltransferase